ncbi:MAG: LysR substrate-binding domain-containing protein [Burkholderiales bacterium]
MPQSRIRRYLRHGTLPQLAVFEASARHGCFTRAGEELHLAQPTVSSQIRKLAETVGAPLFETVGRSLRLTEAGRRTYAHCQEIFGVLGRLDDALAELRDVEGSELRIAVAGAASRHAARLLAGFAREHETVAVRLEVCNRASLLARMAQREDDLYLFSNPPADVPLVRQRIASSAFVVVAAVDHPLSRERAIPLAALRDARWVLRERGSGTRAALMDLLAQAGASPRVALELACEDAIACAVAEGAGLALVDRDTAQASRAPLKVLDVEGFPLARTWHLAYPVGVAPSPAALALLRHARETAAPRGESIAATTSRERGGPRESFVPAIA